MSYTLSGINFSPYIAGENPANGTGQISVSELTARSEAIAPYTDSFRTFDCTADLQPESQIIRSLGKTAQIGVWLQDDDPAHQAQIDAANQAGVNELIRQAHAGLVLDVAIVGSETQQRGKFAESKLLFYINQVKADFASNHLNIPVTTADTYPVLLQHPNVLASVDIVFANFYPFWEGQPVEVAIADLNYEYHNLQDLVPNKVVYVSESGWPSAGSAQGAAVPTPENAASYAVNFVSWARANNVAYSYFEAFDEPFKASQEGDVGPHWGMFNSNLTLKPGMQQIFDGVTVSDNWSSVNFSSMPKQMTTNIDTFILSGSTAPGNSVAVGDVLIPQGEIDTDGAYSHAIPLDPGNNSLTITVRDPNGNVLSTATKTVTFDANYSTSGRGLLYVDAVSNSLNGTIVIDPVGREILGIIPGKHVRGISADGREIYMDDRTVISKSTHQLLRTLPFTQTIPANGFLVSPTGDQLYSRNEVVDVGTNTVRAPLPMDITTGNSFGQAPIPGGPAITPDGKAIFAGDPIKRIDIQARTVSAAGIGHTGAFLSDIAISSDAKWLVVSSYGAGGWATIYDAVTLQAMGEAFVGDFAGQIRFLNGNRAAIGNAGNPANGGGGVSVIDLTTAQVIQKVPIMLAANLTTNGTGSDLFATTGIGLGVEDRAVGTDGKLKQATTFDLGINRYVHGFGIPANDQIRGLFFSPAPVVSINRTTPLGPTTNTSSVVYTVTFGKNVIGVDATDFSLALSGVTTTPPLVVSGSGATYTVTVNNIAGTGTLGLNLVDDDTVLDDAGNPLGGVGVGNGNFIGQVYIIDRIAPTVLSINRTTPPGSTTSASSVVYTVTFSESVSGIDPTDFGLALSGVTTTPPLVVSGSGATYTVTVNNIAGTGTLGLNLVDDDTVLDDAGNPLGGAGNGNFIGQVYIIDRIAPTVLSINRTTPPGSTTSASSVVYTVTFSESVSGIDPTDFGLALSGVTTTPPLVVSGSGSVYIVTINGIADSGTLGLNLVDDDSIKDAVNNSLGGSGAGNGNFIGQVYIIDRIAPTVLSINRTTPPGSTTSASSVAYTVTFSESVSGIDPTDFGLALSGVTTTPPLVVSGSGSVYIVTINGIADSGTLGLNLVDDDSIKDAVNNSLGGSGAGNGNFIGQVYTRTVTSPTFQDNFDRPNSANLGQNWTNQTGGFGITSLSAIGKIVGSNIATVNSLNLANSFVQADAKLTAVGQSVGLMSRYSGPAAANFYLGMIKKISSTQVRASLLRNVNGSWVTLFSKPVVNTGGGTLRIESVGSSLKLFLKGALVAYAQDSLLTVGAVGLWANGGLRFDNFSANTLIPSAAALPFSDNFSTPGFGSQLPNTWLDRLGNTFLTGGMAKGLAGVNITSVNGITMADGFVQADASFTAVGQTVGLIARYTGSGDTNMYLALLRKVSATQVQASLSRNVSGTWLTLSSKKVTSTGGTMRFEVAGSSLKIFLSGSLVASAQDSLLTTGEIGIRTSAGGGLDNFTAT